MKLGIIRGSSRVNGNTEGILRWLTKHLEADKRIEYDTVGPGIKPYPIEPLTGDYMPAMIENSQYYPGEIQLWSRFVDSCLGFIVVTPQYNWGYPGSLKLAFDHLYREWKGKKVLIITFGGHGGGKCYDQLNQVLAGGFDMKVIESRININIPKEYIVSTKRINGDEQFLDIHSDYLKSALKFFTDQQ